MSTAHKTLVMNTQPQARNGANGSSSLSTHVVLPNIALPSRPSPFSPWAMSPKPPIYKPTVCTRYDMPFVYTNATAGLAAHQHQHQTVTSGGGFSLRKFGAVKWMRRAFEALQNFAESWIPLLKVCRTSAISTTARCKNHDFRIVLCISLSVSYIVLRHP
ncbi:hypothetical protein HYPSUDRAFT_202524 [Hypholoma sublateritium FD-334 SS-4]|uniref:Uncharacterized protein n=1 Tax=Hypholoma sublateritium (strain FD-334 SS-4) TaxID=945553 RepID=A0A0D2NZY7_HYPSF|nr:hypothetical protein HYPSUDRAFT_202524 [Hypholoma sublateritium FD-334 SS-4]